MKVNFKKRLKEINFFISKIPDELPSKENEQVIDSNIRASIVLLCSHFEGVLKDIIQSFILDVNLLSLSCNNVPTVTYAKNFIGKNENVLQNINYLVKVLDEYKDDLNGSRPIFLDYKKFNNTESNPTPEVIIKLFRIFGFDNVLNELNINDLNIKPHQEYIPFLKETEKELLLEKIQDESIVDYIDKTLATSRNNKKNQYKYGYYEKINSLLKARNEIVHGNSDYKLTRHEVIELKKAIFSLIIGIYKKLETKLSDLDNLTKV